MLNEQRGHDEALRARAALERLRAHRWPGNVRELRNVVQRAFILAEDEIGPESLPVAHAARPARGAPACPVRVGMSIAEAERRLILATLEHSGGRQEAGGGDRSGSA